ncbi:trichohyalin-like [Montipora capricornis]|uniref:trichohyalin-like n=1 Tax=Montipora capricornis TaxID=246305 RepID=UPI0035F14EAA
MTTTTKAAGLEERANSNPNFTWSYDHDILMCREVLDIEPYQFKLRSPERGKAWEAISSHLNTTSCPKFRVTPRSVRDRLHTRLKMAEPSTCSSSTKPPSSVTFWTKDHDLILCREVLNLNPFTTKKGSTQRSTIWDKVATTLNNCSGLAFNVDKRSVRDHVGILQNRHKKKLRAEEKARGIVPDEPTELENLLEQIIALEQSAEAEQQETVREKSRKIESDRAKAEDIRLKAMEKLNDIQKRQSDGMEDNQSKRPRRSGSSAISYVSQRADINYEFKQEELKLRRDQQEFEKKQMEVSANAQKQFQEQQSQRLKVVLQQQQQHSQQTLLMMQQLQQQTKALLDIMERIVNK